MESLYILLGVAAAGIVILLTKLFGGDKGDESPVQDTERARVAMEAASELLGRRAMAEATADDAKKRVEEKLAIEDPAERLKALADELKDL